MDNNQVDIGKLSKVLTAIKNGNKFDLDRGAGVTTGYLYLMLEQICAYNRDKYYMFISSERDLIRVFREFLRLLTTYNISFEYDLAPMQVIIPKLNQRFLFSREDNAPMKIRGRHISVVFTDLSRLQHLSEYLTYIIHTSGALIL
jgi:hypothetical protein